MIKSLKRIFNKKGLMLLITLSVGTIAFFFVPMAFSPDSSGYIRSGLSLVNEGGIAGLDSYRGPFIPFILSLFFGTIGSSVFAIKSAYYLCYIVMFFSVYNILNLFDMFKYKRGFVTWSLFIFALVLNPTILAYSHLCLSEFPTLAVLCVYALTMTKLYTNPISNTKLNFALKIVVVSLFTVLIYATKQALFVAVLALFFACEMLALFKSFNYKNVLAAIFVLVIAISILFGYLQFWVSVMDGESVEGDSVSSFAGTFLIDGLRYFRVTERGVYNKPITIEVMSCDYETVKSSFEYTFDNSLVNSLEFFFRCLRESPGDVFNSYRSNYLLVTGSRHLLGASGNERAYARVNSTTEFFKGQENAAWTDAFAKIEQPENDNFKLHNEYLKSHSDFDSDNYNDSFARLVLFNSYYRKLAYFQYSFITYNAFLIAVVSAVFIFINRNKQIRTMSHKVNFVCALTIFCQVMFLAITAQGIDRYGFPLTVFCFVIVINTICVFVEWAFNKIKKFINQFKTNKADSSCELHPKSYTNI